MIQTPHRAKNGPVRSGAIKYEFELKVPTKQLEVHEYDDANITARMSFRRRKLSLSAPEPMFSDASEGSGQVELGSREADALANDELWGRAVAAKLPALRIIFFGAAHRVQLLQ